MAVSRVERLRAYIEAASAPPIIGKDDCGPWVATWITQETGIVVPLPVYSTREEGDALVAAAGGMVEFVKPFVAGLRQTFEPKAGDVGIIALSKRDVAAIFCGHDYVAIRGERDHAFKLRAREFVKAWALP